ncbi:MAG TPA: hypothetical protein PKN29_12690 [Candidatus Ozemobacteraceae bacterium]|nr:hypothetical protein [Candidatus Ozemobacteraceae bacterium]
MKTIPETIQDCNHWLRNCNATQILNPSNSTDLESKQNSSAFPHAKTLGSKPLLNCLRTAETIKHTMCAELRKYLDESTTANPSNLMGLRHQQNLQPLAGENQPDKAYVEGISPALRLILLAKRLLRRCAPRNDVFKTRLQPLIGEINLAKNPLIPANQLAEAYRDQLPSPEAIADRPRLWAGSANAATDNDRPEVVQ